MCNMMLTQILLLSAAIAVTKGFPGQILSYKTDTHLHQELGVPGKAVTGEYRWLGPDGRENVVRYTADENGYVVHNNVVPAHPSPLGEPLLQNNSSRGNSSNESSDGEGGLLTMEESQLPNDMYNYIPAIEESAVPIGFVPFPLRPRNESKMFISTEHSDLGRSTEQTDKVMTTVDPFSTTEMHNLENASDANQTNIITEMVSPTTTSSNQEDESILVTESLHGPLQNRIPEMSTKESLTTTSVLSNDENHTTESPSDKGELVTTESTYTETEVSVSITTETLMNLVEKDAEEESKISPSLISHDNNFDDDGITEMSPVMNENVIEEMNMKNLSTEASDIEVGIIHLTENSFYFEDNYVKETTVSSHSVDETNEKRHTTFISSTSEDGPVTTVLPVDHEDNGKNGMNTEIPLDFEYDEEEEDDTEITELPPTLTFGDKVKHQITEMTPLDHAETSTPPGMTVKNTNEILGIPSITGEDNNDGGKITDSQILMITNDNKKLTTTYFPRTTTEANEFENVTTVSSSSTGLMQDDTLSSKDVNNNSGTTESVPLIIAVKGMDNGENSMSGKNESMTTQESMNDLNSADDNNVVHGNQMTGVPVDNSLSSNSTDFSDTGRVTDMPPLSPSSTASSDNITVESGNGELSPGMPLDNEIVKGGTEESSPAVPSDNEVVEDADDPTSAVPSDNEVVEDAEDPTSAVPSDNEVLKEVEEPSSAVPSDNERVEGGAQEPREGTPSTNQIKPVKTPKEAPQKRKKKKGHNTSPEFIFANALLNRLFPTTRSPLIKEFDRPCYGASLLCSQPRFHHSSSDNPHPNFHRPPYYHVPPTHHHPFKPLFDVFPGTPRPIEDRLTNGQVFSFFH